MSAMRGREGVLLSAVVVVAGGIRRGPAPRSSSVSQRDPVMRAGTAAKIAAATWLGNEDFM